MTFSALFHPFKKLKTLLPQTLLGRSLIIVIAPVLLVQGVMTYVFIDRHLSKVTELLAQNISGGVSASLDLLSGKTYEDIASDSLIPFVREHFHLEMSIQPPSLESERLHKQTRNWLEDYLEQHIRRQVSVPFHVEVGDSYAYVHVYPLHKDLIFTFETKRLFSKTTWILLWWALGTPILFLFIAILFLRNQVRPLRRLSEVVEAFGKGQEDEILRPGGAQELRKVAEAFNAMRARIRRQIEQRTHLLAGVSHDLRTPLARMSLQIEVMPKSEDLEALKADLRDMEAMLASYLAFARGDVAEETTSFSLQTLLTDVMRGVSPEKVTIVLPKKEIWIKGRRNALQRCLSNLVQNGVRYAPHLWVEVISLENEVHFILDDDGPGIPVAQQKQVFKPFMRLEGSRNTETGGTGLGLSIARDIARSHGGDILLHDSPRGGLRVRFVLPL